MPNHSDARKARNKTTLSLSLAILIIIMDMSGLAGLAAQEELEEAQEKRETLSGINMPGFQEGLANSSTTFDVASAFACAILSDGGIYCWGDNDNYNFGDGTMTDSQLPTATSLPSGLTAEHISIGEYSNGHHCAILSDSNAYCWGYNYPAGVANPSFNSVPAQVPLDSTVTLVESGSQHSCAILSNGSVQCWGRNYDGQLGIGYTCQYSSGDCANEGTTYYLETPVYPILPVNSVAVGLNLWEHNTCVILENTSYYCFGDDSNSPWPTYKKTGIAAASGHILMHSDQTVEYWSEGYSYQRQGWYGDIYIRNQANDSIISTNWLPSSTKFTSFVGNADTYPWAYNSIGLLSNGTVVLNANDEYTSMGINNALNYHGYLSRTFYEAPSNLNVAGVSTFKISTSSPTCIIYDNGSAQCWGHYLKTGSSFVCSSGAYDQFGNLTGCTDDNYVSSPVWVEFPTGLHIELDEMDDDGDGIINMGDRCPSGATSWTSTPSSDYDSDGCRDSDEDDDDDADGHLDSADAFPLDETRYRIWTADEIGRQGVANDAIKFNSCNYISESGVASVSSSQDNQPDSWSLHNGPDGSCTNSVLNETGSYTYEGGSSSTGPNATAEWSILVEIASGGGTWCGLLASNGTLACFGEGQYGILGQGNTTDSWNELTYPELPFNSKVKYINTIPQSIYVTLENGQVYAWGTNYGNFLGVGFSCSNSIFDLSNHVLGCIYNTNYLSKPSRVTTIGSGSGSGEDFTNITQITHSSNYYWIEDNTICALNTDGEVLCRGGYYYGQDGDGTLSLSRNHLSKAILPNNVTDIAQGELHTCALLDNGSVYCFGGNTAGQMGDGTICEPLDFSNGCDGAGHNPVADAPVALPAGRKALQIWGSPSSSSTTAFLDDGTKWVWGGGNPTPYQYSGSDFFPAQSTHDRDGDGVDNLLDNCGNGLSDWTSNSSNDVDGDGCFDATEDTDDDGDGFSDTTETACSTNPGDASDYPLDTDLDGICNANDNDDDDDGILDVNDDSPLNQYGFSNITLGAGFQAGAASDNSTFGASTGSTCAILEDDTIVCWGANNYGQIGDGTDNVYRSTPTTVNLPSGKVPASLSEGEGYHHCSVMGDGSLYCWGKNFDGQLGHGTTCASESYANNCNGDGGVSNPTAVDLPSGLSAAAVSSGVYHTCAILSNGSVWCWGGNNYGQLGDGTNNNSATPVQTALPAGRTALSVTSGREHSCAVLDNGSAYCWGRDSYGQLGRGSYGSHPLPGAVLLPVNSSASMISAGYHQTCAILTNGSVWCWGYHAIVEENTWGASYPTSQSTPTQIGLFGGNAISISVGYSFACALLDSGYLYCWGASSNGRLGIGETNESYYLPTIVTMPDSRTSVAVSVGNSHTCALLDDTSLVCWGAHNGYTGTIGTGQGVDPSTFTTISYYNSPQFVAMSTGDFTQVNTRDQDGDGVFNHEDRCPYGETGWTSDSSTDFDDDGCQDSSEDIDDDNDDLLDTEEDANNNGIWDSATETNPLDADTDDDGFIDSIDDLPLDSTEWLDTDSDGIGNNADNDDDNDGWADLFENMCGTNPLDSNSIPNDFDGDGDCDEVDSDDDNDGTSDSMDAFPFDSSADADTDGDGMPDTMFVPDITQIPVDGLIGYWNFDDSSGNPIDSSGESHVSTAFGNLSYGEEGHANDAIQFDGDGDYVEIEANDVFNVTNITISAWVKLEDLNVNPWTPGSVICRGNGFEEVWCIDLVRNSNNTYYRFWHRHSDLNWSYSPVITTTSADMGWNHILVTYDGTVSKIYFNGILESSTTAISGALSPSNESVYIATRQNAQSGGLPINDINATIDELRIYNRALNNSEIQLLYEVSYTLIEDHDDDNDGWTDIEESECGTSSLNSNDIPTDTDLDGYCNVIDAFPLDPNEWEDSDGDGVGDNSDIFPEDPTETTDTDGDGIGDNIDPDADNDGWNDSDEDVCLTDWLDSSSVPGDIDSDGICDALETDLDNDGWSNANETACGTDMNDINSVPLDTDGDMICDIMDGDIDGDLIPNDQDVFPLNPLEWYDFDGDGIGDNTDPDDDNDGCMDVSDDLPFDPTECDDTDGDGTGNNVDIDDDGDGVIDVNDPFPLDGAATVDTDGDGLPDFLNGTSSTGLLEDNDDDNDGYNDSDDAFPLDLTEWLDTDGDGIGNNADVNDDGDNCPDVIDAFPLNPAECFDTDGDGIGNNADSDDDNDGWLDGTEMACGTSDPLNASSVPDDFDSDGVCDLMDFDDDNDSIVDASDAFPFDPCASVDTDGDGLPDELFFNCNTTLVEDWDDDNDGYNDTVDLFPQDANEWSDFDMDGFGDNMDTDDDGDMVPDDYDLFPLNSSEWADNDGDGIGDNADLDDDNDGTEDLDDDFPLTFGITTDTDGDGLPDNMTAGYNGTLSEDLDDDGDGVLDIYDQFPLDATEWSDTDLDGIGNNADSDDDGDGWSDNDEWICGTDTLDANDVPDDSDGDGICDSEDDEDLTTLTGRAEFYLKSPVTVWMALVGIIAGMIGGATSTSFRARKERDQLYNEMRDFTDSVRDNVDYTRPIPRQPISVTESKDTEIKNLVDQGYSQEVAEALFESQR